MAAKGSAEAISAGQKAAATRRANAGGGAGVSFSSKVVIDPSKLADLLRSENGAVYRYMFKLGDRVKDRAKELVGVSKPDPVPRSKPRKPGNLRDHIVKRIKVQGDNVIVEVGAEVPYALFHHEGIPGGVVITPKKKNGMLVFYWDNGPRGAGIYAYRRVVQGRVEPNRFLVDALEVLND